MKRISLVASILLATTTSAFAESDSIKEAISYGVASGDITAFYKNENTKNDDEGFLNGSLGVSFQTDSFKGVNAKVGFRANHKFSEREDGNYKDEFENKALMTESYLQYRDVGLKATVGRQIIDLEWLGDYNEAITFETKKLMDNTTISLAYVDRQAESEEDESSNFEEISEKGLYAFDFNYEIEEDESEINAYYYSAPDLVDFYGIKAKGELGMFEFTAHYAASSVDVNGEEDGNILNLEFETEISNFEFVVGYIRTDKEGGVGMMDSYGDNIDPTEELDESIYAADSQTAYAAIEYAGNGLEAELIYAEAKHGENNDKDKELTVAVEYEITDSLSTEIIYTTTSMEDSDDDLDVTQISLAYSF
jgi:hypothetical protein